MGCDGVEIMPKIIIFVYIWKKWVAVLCETSQNRALQSHWKSIDEENRTDRSSRMWQFYNVSKWIAACRHLSLLCSFFSQRNLTAPHHHMEEWTQFKSTKHKRTKEKSIDSPMNQREIILYKCDSDCVCFSFSSEHRLNSRINFILFYNCRNGHRCVSIRNPRVPCFAWTRWRPESIKCVTCCEKSNIVNTKLIFSISIATEFSAYAPRIRWCWCNANARDACGIDDWCRSVALMRAIFLSRLDLDKYNCHLCIHIFAVAGRTQREKCFLWPMFRFQCCCLSLAFLFIYAMLSGLYIYSLRFELVIE